MKIIHMLRRRAYKKLLHTTTLCNIFNKLLIEKKNTIMELLYAQFEQITTPLVNI